MNDDRFREKIQLRKTDWVKTNKQEHFSYKSGVETHRVLYHFWFDLDRVFLFGFIRKMGLKPRRSTTAFYSILLSTKIIRENQTIVLEDLNVSGMIKNRKLSRAISDLGWQHFRTMLEAK